MSRYTAAPSLVILALLLLLSLTGCEQSVTIEGTVHISPQLQKRFSPSRPGLLLVRADVPKSSLSNYSLGLLCEPQEETLTVPFEYDQFGCAKEGAVTAWIETIDRADAAQRECGLAQERYSGALDPERTLARASAVVFAGNTGQIGCSSGHERVDLLLGGE